jgi:type IV secretory pathway VirB10-like protein
LREATSVNKGWVVVGLVLLLSGLAGFQVLNSPAYAQMLENGTVDSSSVTDLPSNPLQNQLLPYQNSLIATPEPSPDDLNPSQQDPSVKGGDEIDQQTPMPNTETSSENTADEQSLDTGETIENSIVQDRLPQDRAAAPSQPGSDANEDQDTVNSDDQEQQSNEQDGESNDNGNDDAEEEGNDQDDTEQNDRTRTSEIPSSLRLHDDIVPFP